MTYERCDCCQDVNVVRHETVDEICDKFLAERGTTYEDEDPDVKVIVDGGSEE